MSDPPDQNTHENLPTALEAIVTKLLRRVDQLKAQYPTVMRRAFVGAIVLHIVVFAFAPPPPQVEPALATAPDSILDVEYDNDPNYELIPEEPAPAEPDVAEPMKDPIATDDDLPLPQPQSDLDHRDTNVAPRAESTPFEPWDKLPVLQTFQPPEYPELAREAGIEGIVNLLVTVGANGKVIDVEVYSSDVTPAMEHAAVTAAWKWTFQPAQQGSKRVPAKVVVPIGFALNR